MAVTGWFPSAGVSARTGIDSEFKPFGMDVVGEGGNPGRKGLGILSQATLHSRIGLPEVIDHDIAVTDIS